jgi:hypothetical protein
MSDSLKRRIRKEMTIPPGVHEAAREIRGACREILRIADRCEGARCGGGPAPDPWILREYAWIIERELDKMIVAWGRHA